jgi:hypothetical protein
VGGKLAQIGSRLIDSTARRMADDFFDRFAAAVTDGEPQPAANPEFPSAVAPAEPARAAAAKKAPTKKSPAKKSPAKKSPAKKTAAKNPAAKKSARKPREPGPPPEFASEPAPPPTLMPEAAVAASAAPRREEPRQPASQPQSMPGNNVWWIVGAGIAALLVILVLANV